jgi:hypothetical protein
VANGKAPSAPKVTVTPTYQHVSVNTSKSDATDTVDMQIIQTCISGTNNWASWNGVCESLSPPPFLFNLLALLSFSPLSLSLLFLTWPSTTQLSPLVTYADNNINGNWNGPSLPAAPTTGNFLVDIRVLYANTIGLSNWVQYTVCTVHFYW